MKRVFSIIELGGYDTHSKYSYIRLYTYNLNQILVRTYYYKEKNKFSVSQRIIHNFSFLIKQKKNGTTTMIINNGHNNNDMMMMVMVKIRLLVLKRQLRFCVSLPKLENVVTRLIRKKNESCVTQANAVYLAKVKLLYVKSTMDNFLN